ncbi:RNase3 domain protein [Aspergillus clavatus NRRL 1]|uniref:RNase3 domain protein n=1 Tax=Aspergillus clavatus (strain ATCC 1007 / CBS 513.65 / DSM 816 / NCTC 3887 / NRRL 1 / QM 1276 / 107) TaxID=344612 RepID=A1CDG7_ASPCL|nr:RNase3 domain protein [Aspergillus clavatus NRRL 1]EAW11894.1 RNase3 domain protein [Aspergillus clavatus NRRL 1]
MSLSDKIEQISGYRFRDERLLHEAMTAAGADENNHDGNRPLAQVGKSFVELCSVKFGYLNRTERALKIQNINNDRCALIAKEIGIDQHLTYCPRHQGYSKKVLNIAVNALIGAINIDSDSEEVTITALHRIGWFSFPLNKELGLKTGRSGSKSSKNLAEPRTTKPLENQTCSARLDSMERVNEGISVSLRLLLESETQRCVAHQMKPPQETYFGEAARAELLAVQTEFPKASLDLLTLFFTLAGPQSIVGFQENILGALAASNPLAELYYTEAPPQQRFAIIRTLEQIECHYDILKNYHTWQLYQSCTGQHESGRLHIISYESHPTRQSGNPINLRESRTTERMVALICPEAEPNSTIFESNYNKFKSLRRKGKRLQSLIDIFGLGILGLMYSSPGHQSGCILTLSHFLYVRGSDILPYFC